MDSLGRQPFLHILSGDSGFDELDDRLSFQDIDRRKSSHAGPEWKCCIQQLGVVLEWELEGHLRYRVPNQTHGWEIDAGGVAVEDRRPPGIDPRSPNLHPHHVRGQEGYRPLPSRNLPRHSRRRKNHQQKTALIGVVTNREVSAMANVQMVVGRQLLRPVVGQTLAVGRTERYTADCEFGEGGYSDQME